MRTQAPKLVCGLEVHQQLETGKLFCRCPSLLKEGKADYSFERKLRPVASELGEFDAAALEQFKRGYSYEYHAFNDCCCLVECDEEPPQKADSEALKTALKISMLCKAVIPSELFVMRKIVIDGSNTSGFQRTMLISKGGFIEVNNKKIGIQTIVLEEDSARPLEKKGSKIVYSLDRQGIPLIEIATKPEIKTPQEAKECAKKIGELLRRTCKAKRGLGTIRQDLNISISNGARIELKGVQELNMIDVFVEREIQRQKALLKIRNELKKRKTPKPTAMPVELTAEFKKTKCKIIEHGIKEGKKVYGMKLTGFSGILGMTIQPGRRFGTELADYLKARHNVPGLFHSDELPAYGFSLEEKKRIAKKLKCSEKDAFVIIVCQANKAESAMKTIAERSAFALKGVPEETRNALENGNSAYSRPLPGAARMYPETDLASIKISRQQLEDIGKELPKSIEERLKLYKKMGLSEKLAEEMKLSNWACFFERAVEKGANAKTTAVFLLEKLKQLERDGIQTKRISMNALLEIVLANGRGELEKGLMAEALKKHLRTGKEIKEIIKGLSEKSVDVEEIEGKIKKIVKENRELVEKNGNRAINMLMGDAMKELQGKADGRKVSEVLRREIEKITKSNR